MVIGAVVVGYRRECTRELTREQQGTLKKFKGKIVEIDTDGNEYILHQEICNHQKDGLAVAKDDMFVQHT